MSSEQHHMLAGVLRGDGVRRRQLARVPLPARRLRQVLRRHCQGPRARRGHEISSPTRGLCAHHVVMVNVANLLNFQMLHAVDLACEAMRQSRACITDAEHLNGH